MMKKVLLILMVFAFAKADFLQAQVIDWHNAPLNPVALRYKLNHYNLKNDVYLSGRRTFDAKGRMSSDNLLIRSYTDYPDDRTIINYGYRYTMDENGRIVIGNLMKVNVNSKSYSYNNQGNLTTTIDGSSGTLKYTYYDYDANGRIIAEREVVNTIEEKKRSYIYESIFDGLKITITDDLEGKIKDIQVWKNGYQFQRLKPYTADLQSSTFEFDNKGNIKTEIQGTRRFNHAVTYHDDLKKPYKVTIKRMADKKPLFSDMYEPFRDNELAKDMVVEESGDDALIYDPFTKNYWRYLGAFKRNSDNNQRFEVAQIPKDVPLELEPLIKNKDLLITKGKYRWEFWNRGQKQLNAKILPMGNDIMIVSKNSNNLEVSYLCDNVKKTDLGSFYPVEPYNASLDMIYLWTPDKLKVEIIVKGDKLLAQNIRWGKLRSGDMLLFMDDIPKYIFPNLDKIKVNEFSAGRNYQGEAFAQ